MKRSSLPFLLAAIIAVSLGFSVKHDPSLSAEDFESRFRAAVRASAFQVLSQTSGSAGELSLPLSARLNLRNLRGSSAQPHAAVVPDSTVRYVVGHHGAEKADCVVRYDAGHAQVIEVRPRRGASVEASLLSRAIREHFGDFPMRIRGE